MEIFYCELRDGQICTYKGTDEPESSFKVAPSDVRYCGEKNLNTDCRLSCNRAEVRTEQIHPVDNGDGCGPS